MPTKANTTQATSTTASKTSTAVSYKVESDVEESNLEKTLNDLARQGYTIENTFINRNALYSIIAHK